MDLSDPKSHLRGGAGLGVKVEVINQMRGKLWGPLELVARSKDAETGGLSQ